MKQFLYIPLVIISLALSFNAFGESLTGKTITVTDKTGKPLIVKTGNKSFTLVVGESKIFDFEKFKGAETGYMGSVAPYRPLELAPIALGLQRSASKNVNVDLIPGTIWSAKIANISYGLPPKYARPAELPARSVPK